MDTYLNHKEFFEQFEKDMKNTCINCTNQCTCKLLAEYLRKVGIVEFKKQYYNFNLPKDIENAFFYYFELSTDFDNL